MVTFEYTYQRETIKYTAQVSILDEGVAIVLAGGLTHIGTLILAEPRKSLVGDGSWSATSSVMNRTGHLDDKPMRKNAECLAARLQVPVVVTGGIHIDQLSADGIQEVVADCEYIFKEIEKKIKKLMD